MIFFLLQYMPVMMPFSCPCNLFFQVANAMAAKAKLLLRELKSVKADLAFAKQRCAQLEEENKMLRETKQKGSKTEEDDDLVVFFLNHLAA